MPSKKSRIKHELYAEIAKERKYGEKRHEAKQEEMRKAIETGEGYQQPRGIYSYETEATYKRQSITFIDWVLNNHSEVRCLDDAKKYVGEYLESCKDKGLSPATVKTYAHALACAYHCNVSDFEVEIPRVSRDDIKRTRNVDSSSFSPETQDIHDFASATGARREGLRNLRTDCLRETDSGNLEIYLDEKGGKARWARVVAGKKEFVRSIVNAAKERNFLRGDGCMKVFPDNVIPSKEALHQHRHEYAKSLYDEVMRSGEYKIADRPLYRCRGSRLGQVFNRTALAIVSLNLGHGQPGELPHEVKRVGVVVNNYLYED